MRPTEGEFCWARTHVTCAAGSGVPHLWRSPAWRLPFWQAAAAARAARAAADFLSGATGLFGGSTKIAVAPIIGATPEVSQELTTALVAAGKDRNLTLLPDGGKATYTLRGYLIASNEGKGSKISYIWDVNDAQGTRVARVSGDEVIATRSGGDPWSGVDSAAIRSIAGKTTSQLAASLSRGGGSASAVAAASDGAVPVATASTPRAERGERQSLRRGRGPRLGRPWRRPEIADHSVKETPLCRRDQARQRHREQRLYG